MFFRDLNQTIYPIAAIARMTHVAPPAHKRNAGYYEVDLTSGEACRVSYEQVHQLMRLGWRYVPATPGTCLLDRKEDRTANDPFHRIPVLAWGVDEEGALQPLTSEGASEVTSWAVLTPDGRVSDQFGSSFANEESYIASLDAEE